MLFDVHERKRSNQRTRICTRPYNTNVIVYDAIFSRKSIVDYNLALYETI